MLRYNFKFAKFYIENIKTASIILFSDDNKVDKTVDERFGKQT
jgi:hypothetical protein